jgi:hypothetical protein
MAQERYASLCLTWSGAFPYIGTGEEAYSGVRVYF